MKLHGPRICSVQSVWPGERRFSLWNSRDVGLDECLAAWPAAAPGLAERLFAILPRQRKFQARTLSCEIACWSAPRFEEGVSESVCI